MPGSNLVPVDQLKIKANQYGVEGAGLPAYQREFIQRFAPYAMLASAQSGIPARFLLAEASIETNWGQSKGAREDNNLFGIKATPAQIAAGVPVSYRDTGENAANGAAYTEKAAAFIKYPSAEAGFNGFVEKLNKTRWADQKALLKHTAENPYAQDNDVETALAGAFARTSYLTADKIDQTMLDRMARMPSDLNAAGFKTAPDFNKATTDLASIAPFDPAQARNVSTALGDFTDNDYVSPNGIPITARPRELNALDRFSDGITEGIEGAGAAVGNTFSGFGNAIRGAFGIGAQASGGTTPTGPAPGDYDFANGGTPGGIGDANFGFGLTPGRNIDANGNAHQGGAYDLDPNGPGGFGAGTDVSGGVGNGTFFGLGGLTGGGAGSSTLPTTPAPTLAPPPGTSTINSMYEAILRRPGDAAGLQAFDAQLDSGKMDLNQIQAMLRGSEEAKTLGPLGEARTYSPLETVFARQLDRAPDAQAIQNWGTAQNIDPVEAFVYGSPEAQTYRAGLGDTASLIRSPSTAPTIGPGATTDPIGPFGFTGTFKPSEYLKANTDVAAAGMDALTHYATYGYNEGRALDTAGHRINQGFDAGAYLAGNRDVAAAGLDPLEHYVQYGAAEGRALPAGSTAPYQFSGVNVSQGAGQTGNGSFSSGFDGEAYLKQNRDVADAGMNPMDHYLRYGFAEGRAINGGGTKVNEGFDPSAYLAQNKDVAAAHLDPLEHYARYGVSEGRAAPTGSNPYSFSNFNVAQGAGPVGAGSFGLGDVTGGGTGGGSAPSGSSIPSFGFGQNVSQNVGPGSFGAGITPSPAPSISSFGFSGANVSGGLGATAQGLGSSYAVGSAADLGFGSSGGGGGSGGDGTIDPYGFGGDVSGFDVNNLGGSAVQESAGASGFGDGVAIQGRNNQASQNAFIAGEFKKAADSTAAARQLGEQITNVAPGNQTNYALGAINPTPTPQIQHTQFTPVNMSGVFAPPPTIAFMPRFAG